MKNILKKFNVLYKLSSEKYIKRLRKMGAQIGEGTKVFYPMNVFIDDTRPWMLDIGKNVQITKNVSILTHDYSWSVIKGKYGEICGACGKVKIGDNVFIGFNSTILKGVTIGNNVIIGANTVISKDIPDNVVVAGNPAKVIMSLDDFYEKRKKSQIEEACLLVNEYIKRYNKKPTEKELREFLFLFEEITQIGIFDEIMRLLNNHDVTMNKYQNVEKKFKNIEELIEYAQKNNT